MAKWGVGPWGIGSWGLGEEATTPPAPTLIAVSAQLADVKGGTVLGVFGTNFVDPLTIEILDPVGGEVLGTAYYFEAKLDLRSTKVLAGFPALPTGTYDMRVHHAGGSSGILTNAVTYAVFAEEGKVHRVRRRYTEFWSTGERLLT